MGRRDHLPHDALIGIYVLEVDDAGNARDRLRTVLEYCGALVTVVAMPTHDGYWLIGSIRALPAEHGGTIPAVAITAHGESPGPDRPLAAGFQAHLRKPLDPWQLCRALGSLTRKP